MAKWVASAAKVRAAPDDRRVTIAVHMALRNQAELKKLADEVSKPDSAQYGHYLTATELRNRFAPDARDVAAVRALLSRGGMSSISIGPSGAYVSASATVAQLRSTFAVSQDVYRFGASELRANKEDPAIPAALAGKILFIEGLDDTTYLKHPYHVSATVGELVAPKSTGAKAKFAVTPPPVAANLPSAYCDTYIGDLKATVSTSISPYPKTLPWLNCGYTPQQIRAAYGIDKVKFDGTGIRVAIVDAYASPTLMADGNSYAKKHNLPALTAQNFTLEVPEGIYNVSPSETCGPYGWWTEESLDLASVHGTAPGANIIYIGARDCGTSLSIALVNAIYNQAADIITNSYGFNGEADNPADIAMQDQSFMVAAAEGVTVLFSSGDDGDLSQVNGVASGAYAATSPYVTGVGGTSLELANAKGGKAESGWGTYRDYLGGATVKSGTSIITTGLETTSAFGDTFDAFAFYSGSGGGISLIEPQPAYQAGVVPAALATGVNEGNGNTVTLQQKQRVSPDVAMDADPYTGYLYGETFTIAGNSISDAGCTKTTSTTEYCETAEGGTSLASPLMAGVLALVDQARIARAAPVVGFANPWLYRMTIGATLNSAPINDILPPATPHALLRGYANDLTRVRVVTITSVPFLIDTAPFAIEPCGLKICEGLDDVFNYVTKGYDDVTGLGVPYVPLLVKQ